MRHWLLPLLTLAQSLAGLGLIARLGRTAHGERIAPVTAAPAGGVTVLVPVLNEVARLGPCLRGLAAQPPAVTEILVIDGGSTDGTGDVVRAAMATEPRLRFLSAAPVPAGVNGKAHNLQAGLAAADPANAWLLTMDADVRPAPHLIASLLAHQATTGVAALSVATRQDLAGSGDAIIHPALLTTLVYRYGIPGHATRHPARAQANGQCCLLDRPALTAIDGFTAGLGSVCEDVTIARRLAGAGQSVGFYEGGDLVTTAMYGSAAETWRNWSRSLPMLDGIAPVAGWLGLLTVLLAQGLPLPMLGVLRRVPAGTPGARAARVVNLALVATRLGVLAGTRRAYRRPPPTYWLSPLADLPASLLLIRRALQREHTWRGRRLRRDYRRTTT